MTICGPLMCNLTQFKILLIAYDYTQLDILFKSNYSCRYGPVQSVKYLPCKDGEDSGPGANVSSVTVAFMDIKSACKALQSQHKLDERFVYSGIIFIHNSSLTML